MNETFRPVVIVPTYHNPTTVVEVLRRIAALGHPIIVVDDGCRDETPGLLRDFAAECPQVQVLMHEENRGKGAALLTGFAAAAERGFTHAATIDSDGQLDPADLPAFLDAARSEPNALVLGVRDLAIENYPTGSRIGRTLSNLGIKLECGRRVSDSQCGLRVYPLELFRHVRFHAGRFALETEVIARAVWAGCEIRELPVRCSYQPRGRHTSHFRPWVDSLRGIALHLRLLGRSILPIPHAKPMRSPEAAKPKPPLLQRLWNWFNPKRAWAEIMRVDASRNEVSFGFAVGVFIANLPVYPFQTALAIYAAQRLHLHPTVVVIGSAASTPPIGIALVAAAIGVGHLLLFGQWPPFDLTAMQEMRPWDLAGRVLGAWVVGSLIIGAITATLGFILCSQAIRFLRRSHQTPAGAADHRLSQIPAHDPEDPE